MKDWLAMLAWRIGDFFFPAGRRVTGWALGGRGAAFVIVAVYGWWFLRAPIRVIGENPRFIHSVLLVFHEAGTSSSACSAANSCRWPGAPWDNC